MYRCIYIHIYIYIYICIYILIYLYIIIIIQIQTKMHNYSAKIEEMMAIKQKELLNK